MAPLAPPPAKDRAGTTAKLPQSPTITNPRSRLPSRRIWRSVSPFYSGIGTGETPLALEPPLGRDTVSGETQIWQIAFTGRYPPRRKISSAFAQVAASTTSVAQPRAAATAAPTRGTRAGELGVPRWGTGVRNGASVSTRSRSRGHRATAARTLAALGKGDDAAERECGAEVQRQPGLFGSPGEAMKDGSGWCPFGPQNGPGVVPRLPGVDDKGQIVLAGQGDLGREGVALGRPRGVVVVVVEAALAHRHHLGPTGSYERVDGIHARWRRRGGGARRSPTPRRGPPPPRWRPLTSTRRYRPRPSGSPRPREPARRRRRRRGNDCQSTSSGVAGCDSGEQRRALLDRQPAGVAAPHGRIRHPLLGQRPDGFGETDAPPDLLGRVGDGG